MSWLIEVDGDTCIGSGMCVGTAPEHFDLETGVSRPVSPGVEAADEVIDAAEFCPVEAIMVRDAADGRVVAPEE